MNDPQVMQLQREAAQRVQRMAERSRRLVREHPVHIYRGTTVAPAPPCAPPPVTEEPVQDCAICEEVPAVCEPAPPVCRPSEPSGGTDQESLLLLLLLVMLWRNHAPMELLLALLYIAL